MNCSIHILYHYHLFASYQHIILDKIIKGSAVLVSLWLTFKCDPSVVKIILWAILLFIMKTRLFKYTENFPTKKWKFLGKKFWYVSYFCSKHKLWYSLEPPQRGGSNEYLQSMFLGRNKKNNVYPYKPQFYYIKVGFKGVKIIYVCFRDVASPFQ